MTDIRFAKLTLFINGAVPLALLGWDAYNHQLGADPSSFAIHTTGILALVFLTLSLVVTPVRKLSGWNAIIFSRRTLGLYAFFYASLHLFLYYSLDQDFDVGRTFTEIFRRIYLLIGFASLMLMAPLAATSFNVMIKKLGPKRWRALHRLVYLSAILGSIHYYLQSKADKRIPWVFIIVLAFLLAFRLIAALFNRKLAPITSGFPIMTSTSAKPAPKLWSGKLRIARITRETPSVRTFRLTTPDGTDLPFSHLPGQYLILNLLIDGKKVRRTYTIASPPHAAYCEITVKREDHGLSSRHLHDTLHEGDLLDVSAPAGRFTFAPDQANAVVLIAAGVGITPLMSIARHLTTQNWPGDIFFLYSAKTPADIIFREELDHLQKRHPNFHCTITLTQPPADWPGRRGRITADLLKETIPNLTTRPIYICGPTPMMDPTIELLQNLGVPRDQIKIEAFTTARQSETSPVNGDALAPILPEETLTATFTRSQKTISLPPHQTILEAAEAAGLALDFECRSGICGQCKAKCLTGTVAMETQDALTSQDKLQHYILLCQAKALENVTIEA